MTSRWRRAWRELMRSDRDGGVTPSLPAPEDDPWRRAQDWAVDWQVHVEEGDLRLELARRRMRAEVLAEERARRAATASGSGE